MTLDRTEDVELVDAPTTLALSKIWERQYMRLHDLIVKLDRDAIKAVHHPDKKLGSLPNGELTDLNERYNFNLIRQSGITSPVATEAFGATLVWTSGLLTCELTLNSLR